MLETFKQTGYLHIENIINPNLLKITRNLSIGLKYRHLLDGGKPREHGTGVFWSGYEMASKLEPRLFKSYTDEGMYKLASSFLETEDVYLFNDQVVVKLPGEGLDFKPHFDNQYGPNPEACKTGEIKTVNISWVLDDMPSKSGPLMCLNKKTGEWDEIVAKAGDIVAIEGNTLHGSKINNSINVRGLYACVYSNTPIGNFHNNKNYPLPNFKGFYNEKFVI